MVYVSSPLTATTRPFCAPSAGSSRYSPPHGRAEATPLLRRAQNENDDDGVFEDIRAFSRGNTVTISPTVHHDSNGNGVFLIVTQCLSVC